MNIPFLFLVSVAMLGVASSAVGIEFRSIDGSGNNWVQPEWGMAGARLLRLAEPAYNDGISEPRGGLSSSLPSPRAISQTLSDQLGSVLNARGVSDWFWQWGQFIDHDLDSTPNADPGEPFNVPVPSGDPHFDPDDTGTQEIRFNRSAYDAGTGVTNPRQQINEITAYLDASNIYGSDLDRADALRVRGGSGKLKTSMADNGEVLLPYNIDGLPNEGGNSDHLFLAGDKRANEQVGLTAVHTLFVREHNRVATGIADRLNGGDSAITALFDSSMSRGDFIYEMSRKVVGAEIQIITYQEYLPLLLGPGGMASFTGYSGAVDAGIVNEFSTAAYRHGHTLLSPQLYRLTDDERLVGKVPLRDAFFNPELLQADGVDTLLNGLTHQMAQEVDRFVIDDVRNFLFGPPDAGGFDLASLNIQRGRDHGLASLNEMREALGMSRYEEYLELTGDDAVLADLFASVYGPHGVDDVDLWIGGLVESHVNGGMLGETFYTIASDQFAATRDGDRFFYLNELSLLNDLLPGIAGIAGIRLSDIIRLNTSMSSIQENVFMYSGYVPLPGTLVLMFAGALAGFWPRRRFCE